MKWYSKYQDILKFADILKHDNPDFTTKYDFTCIHSWKQQRMDGPDSDFVYMKSDKFM